MPSSELTHVVVAGLSGAGGELGADTLGAGVLGAGMLGGAGGVLVAPAQGLAGLLVVLLAGLVVVVLPGLVVVVLPGGRGGWVRSAASKRLNASLVSPARASAAPANWPLRPAAGTLPSRARRAARQIGHHWHSGGSSVGASVVAVSQTSARLRVLPVARAAVDRTRFVT